jgi:hypothetical protein
MRPTSCHDILIYYICIIYVYCANRAWAINEQTQSIYERQVMDTKKTRGLSPLFCIEICQFGCKPPGAKGKPTLRLQAKHGDIEPGRTGMTIKWYIYIIYIYTYICIYAYNSCIIMINKCRSILDKQFPRPWFLNTLRCQCIVWKPPHNLHNGHILLHTGLTLQAQNTMSMMKWLWQLGDEMRWVSLLAHLAQ